MHWSQTESSKCSLNFTSNHLGHPRTHLYGTSNWSSHFAHVNKQVFRTPAWAQQGGKVVGRKKKETPRLPASFYEAS